MERASGSYQGALTLACIDALEFSLAQAGYADSVTDLERQQLLSAIAQNYATLPPTDQDEAVQQAVGSGPTPATGGGSGSGLGCDTVDACMSRYTPEAYQDMVNAQGCWASASCSSYDPVDNSFTFESYDGY